MYLHYLTQYFVLVKLDYAFKRVIKVDFYAQSIIHNNLPLSPFLDEVFSVSILCFHHVVFTVDLTLKLYIGP